MASEKEIGSLEAHIAVEGAIRRKSSAMTSMSISSGDIGSCKGTRIAGMLGGSTVIVSQGRRTINQSTKRCSGPRRP